MLLQKFVYPYEYINYCEKVNGTSLPEIRDFYSHLNIENIIDTDYKHAKRFYKDFEIKNLSKYHDLYVQNDTLVSAKVGNNFRKMYLKIYELDPERFFFSPTIIIQSNLKKN